MSDITAKGVPFPTDDDLMEDLPAAVQALAGWVNNNGAFKFGSGLFTTDAAGKLSIPHGLGVVPAAAMLQIVNTTVYVGAVNSALNTAANLAGEVRMMSDASLAANKNFIIMWIAVA